MCGGPDRSVELPTFLRRPHASTSNDHAERGCCDRAAMGAVFGEVRGGCNVIGVERFGCLNVGVGIQRLDAPIDDDERNVDSAWP